MDAFFEEVSSVKKVLRSFTRGEWILWGVSVLLITVSFRAFDRGNLLTLAASLTGVTSLIFCAKGRPFGQILMIVFSLLYGAVSFTFAYYGEMLTYLGMTAPMAVFSLVSWLHNPYAGDRSQVAVGRISRKEIPSLLLLTAAVTAVFCALLRALGTANLVPSTVSVATSFLAAYLTFRRSVWFAAAYAANDAVLILLWLLAAREDVSYLPVAVCFLLFLVNDLYGFISWSRMRKIQEKYRET